MTKSIFHQNAESYWNADLSVCPIIPGDKASIKGWNHYIDQIPSAKTRTAWMTDYANYGIGLLTGKRVGDKIIIGIDIDDDRYVEPVKRMFGGIVSGKRGQKGLTIFALAETTVKKTAIPSKGKRIIDILVRSLCVLPPTLHPEIRQPYTWIGTPLPNVDLTNLPIVTGEQVALMKAIFENPNHLALMDGKSTHDPALSLMASLAIKFTDEDLVCRYVSALFPGSYEGNTPRELPEMYQSARNKDWGSDTNKPSSPSIAAMFLEMIENHPGIELFHDGYERTFMSVKDESGSRNMALSSSAAQRWLKHLFYKQTGRSINANAFKEVHETLMARARYEFSARKVSLRIARQDTGEVVVNCADEEGNLVVINEDSWDTTQEPVIAFTKSASMAPLPLPRVGDGTALLKFRKLLGLNDSNFYRVLAFLIGSLKPEGPYLLLLLESEQGSGKSVLSEFIKCIIDPGQARNIRLPESARDLMIQAKENHLLAFDNVSGIKNDISDALCSLSTGGGLSTRKLYTDEELQTFDGCRPFVLNGINGVASRPDLLERSLSLKLPSMPSDQRETEKELRQKFWELLPFILGELYSIVAHALNYLDSVEAPKSIRMVDAAQWLIASEPATGIPAGSFLTALEQSQTEIIIESLSHNSLVTALVKVLETRDFNGTVGTLYHLIEEHRPRYDRYFPATSSHLSRQLERLRPALKKAGIMVEFGAKGRRGKNIKAWLNENYDHGDVIDTDTGWKPDIEF